MVMQTVKNIGRLGTNGGKRPRFEMFGMVNLRNSFLGFGDSFLKRFEIKKSILNFLFDLINFDIYC